MAAEFHQKLYRPDPSVYFRGMNPLQYQARRATLEDLPGLRRLWKDAKLPVADLEKRFTEFQVACAIDGTLAGCMGLQIESQQGKIHSEAFKSLEMKTEVQAALWERLRSVARNHGLAGLWIQNHKTFGHSQGFHEATEEVLRKLPQQFGSAADGWLNLKLREETSPATSIEHEFELFKQAQIEMSERAFRQARVLKFLAVCVTAVVLAFAVWTVWLVLRHLPKRSKH